MSLQNTSIFAVFTGNRFNQVLLFDAWNEAAEWLRHSTRYTEEEIAKAIKTPHWNGENHLDFFDVPQVEKKSEPENIRDQVFAQKVWIGEDIANMLESYGIEPTDGNIQAVIEQGGRWSYLTDCTDGEYECIDEEIRRVFDV